MKRSSEKLKEIKKVLMSLEGYIRMGAHVKQRMYKRGYTKGDIVSAIMGGEITDIQYGFNHDIGSNAFNYVIVGKDSSLNPIVVVLSEEGKSKFLIITVMPPIDHKRFTDCI
ncbi:DUF4258 domain-containing protein [Metabacillus herbersteinensis]|uniref:DUF4258 domain-containing protein n=1 Tax=Metabacillus herbersteinensis TaxID=283816 RepID=A0ABV6GJK1_9BACI